MDTQIEIVYSHDKAYECYDALVGATWAGLDIETTTDPWYHPDFKVLTIAVSTEDGHAWVFVLDHPQAPYPNPPFFQEIIKRLGDDQPYWVMQNGQFDFVALKQIGVNLSTPWFDTMVASYLIDVDAPKGLTDLAQRHLGIPPWKDIDYKHPELEDITVLARLNGRDADYTRRLFFELDPKLFTKNQRDIFNRLMMPACETLSYMEIRGLPVDEDLLHNVIAKYEDKETELLEQLRTFADNETFNPNSHKQVQELLYGKFALPPTVWTDKGAPSSNAEALANIETLHPVVPVLQEFRTVRKLLTASLYPWMEKLDDNSRLHPRYKPAQARTGRLSSEMPNIQQVPRDKEVRGIFGDPRGEYAIIEADYSQLELRIVSWLSGEGEMLAAFRNGDDLHQVTADAFGVDRQTAKSLNFGLLYGAGPRKLRQVAKTDYGVEMSELQAEALRLQWFQKYSAIDLFHASCIDEAIANQGVWTAFGRWRPLPEISSGEHAIRAHAERQAINTPVQSPASDITLAKLVELDHNYALRQLDCRPIATVHDSILFLVPFDNAKTAEEIIKDAMEDMTTFKRLFGVDIDVPLTVDTQISRYWGQEWKC